MLAAAAAAGLVLAVASGGRAAASAAAAAARHACCVCASFFFLIHNADASSTDIDPHASRRSPQISRICGGAYVATAFFTLPARPPILEKSSDSRRSWGQSTLLSIILGISGGFFIDLFSLLAGFSLCSRCFFLLFSRLPSLAAARCGKVQTLLQCSCCFVSAAAAILVLAVASDCRAAS